MHSLSHRETSRQAKPPLNRTELRVALIRNGSSLSRWARSRHYSYRTVFAAIRGERHGRLSRKIILELLAEIEIAKEAA